jgi:glutamate-5-semialdehyde dehydrogenase
MEHVVEPALSSAGLPVGAVRLVDSAEHAAGWALFADTRLALAVARGSGPAVAELGAIARQAGTPVSLHGTGGAWMIVGESFDADRLALCVEHSLDRKVCNTLNTVCVARGSAATSVPLILRAAATAAARRGCDAVVHATAEAFGLCGTTRKVSVARAGGSGEEDSPVMCAVDDLGHEFEWENNPEFHLHVVADVAEAVDLFNRLAPRFIASCISDDQRDHELVWEGCDAPFVGDGFTRWVDGQFALLRPELGLSNWQGGRLFARSAVLSGDSAFTVRLRVRQQDPGVHR